MPLGGGLQLKCGCRILSGNRPVEKASRSCHGASGVSRCSTGIGACACLMCCKMGQLMIMCCSVRLWSSLVNVMEESTSIALSDLQSMHLSCVVMFARQHLAWGHCLHAIDDMSAALCFGFHSMGCRLPLKMRQMGPNCIPWQVAILPRCGNS